MAERRTELFFESLQDASGDVKDLVARGYSLTGGWSLAQILEHLNLAMEMQLVKPNFGYPFFVRPVLKFFMMPIMKKGKPIKMRVGAPSQLSPGDDLDEAATIDRFHGLVDKLTDPATEIQPFHPVVGNLNREQWLIMQKWHAAHHLSFVVPN